MPFTVAGDEFLSEVEYASMRGCSIPTARRDRREGRGPPFVRLGRRIFYRAADVATFMASRVQRSTSDRPGGFAEARK